MIMMPAKVSQPSSARPGRQVRLPRSAPWSSRVGGTSAAGASIVAGAAVTFVADVAEPCVEPVTLDSGLLDGSLLLVM